MAKRKHREQDPIKNEENNNINNNINNSRNAPFGIDPMQLMGLLGGNFDMNNMGNMLSSMNTNGFNLGNLGSIAQMMGINLDNNFLQGNMNNTNPNTNTNTTANNDINKNMYSNITRNMKSHSNNNTSSDVEKKSAENKNSKDNDANLDFLIALKNYAHPDRIKFIDKIIQAYKNGELKGI